MNQQRTNLEVLRFLGFPEQQLQSIEEAKLELKPGQFPLLTVVMFPVGKPELTEKQYFRLQAVESPETDLPASPPTLTH